MARSRRRPATYPDGFPEEIVEQLIDGTGRGVLCNKPYSGTAVIDDYGELHLKTGDLIVYTSADSVLQIAAHATRSRPRSSTPPAPPPGRSCRASTPSGG